jgi:phosphoribosyl 1,2-cyclic phosphate phosphodiesterase
LTVTFLGTGTSQGVPVIGCTCEVCTSLDYRDKRLRTSIHVAVYGQSFVVDTGPDFRQQMLREQIKQVDAVLFTHAHRDHTAGLDDVRAYNFMQEMDMPVYGTQPVLDQLKIEYAYAFSSERYPGIPRLLLRPITTNEIAINKTVIIPLPVLHMKMPVMGFRFGTFSYITDANFISEETFELLKGTEILVLNALQLDSHISHFNLDEALKVVERVQPKKAYFTHISHKLGKHQLVERKLPQDICLAYDGLQLAIR